jgi:purine-binding chemotaxis protein CheW
VAPASVSRTGAAGSAAHGGAQYLTFMLDGGQYAFGILAIKEIIEYCRVTVVPMMPTWIRGVLNLRGSVVPVMDLSARFGGRPTAVTKRTCIVIVDVGMNEDRHNVGLIVDAVNAVLDISPADIEPPPTMGTMIRSDFISGIGKVADRFVIILNAERVLAEDALGTPGEMAAHKPARAATPPNGPGIWP